MSAAGNKKAPDLFRRGFGEVDATGIYDARMPPEPLEGLVVLVVVFAVMVMARTYAAGIGRRQRSRSAKIAESWLNPAWLSRHKPIHEPSYPFRAAGD